MPDEWVLTKSGHIQILGSEITRQHLGPQDTSIATEIDIFGHEKLLLMNIASTKHDVPLVAFNARHLEQIC